MRIFCSETFAILYPLTVSDFIELGLVLFDRESVIKISVKLLNPKVRDLRDLIISNATFQGRDVAFAVIKCPDRNKYNRRKTHQNYGIIIYELTTPTIRKSIVGNNAISAVLCRASAEINTPQRYASDKSSGDV